MQEGSVWFHVGPQSQARLVGEPVKPLGHMARAYYRTKGDND